MEALSQFFIGSLVNSGVHLGRVVRKSVRTFSRNVYFVRKKLVIINTLLTLLSLKRVVHLLETVSSSRGKFMIIDSLYFAHEVYEFPEIISGVLLYKARWVGGLLSNFKLVWRELYLDTLRDPKFRHFLPIITNITKTMYRLPSVIFVSNRQYGLYPMKEASSLMIPVISLLNSNTTVNWAMYWLPANDKSIYSLKFFFELFDYMLAILKLRRLALLRNKVRSVKVKELLWLKNISPELVLDESNKLNSIDIKSKNIKMSNTLLKKTKLLIRNTLPSQYVKIKRFRKPSIVRLVTKMKSISKFKLFRYLKFKKRLLNVIRKPKLKNKTKKVLKRNKIKNYNKSKLIKRFRKSRFFKRNKVKRFIRVSKRRKFLNKVRSRRFKYNKKLSRKKLIRRFNSRKVTKILKRRILFISSRKAVKLANKKLLVRFLDESYSRRLNAKINKKYYSLNPTLSKILKGPKVLKMLFDSISFKLDNLALKQYVIKSSIFLRMTEEEKLAYLDKRNMPLSEKLRMLNS